MQYRHDNIICKRSYEARGIIEAFEKQSLAIWGLTVNDKEWLRSLDI